MPLDPQVKTLLEQIARVNLTPYEDLTPKRARAQLAFASKLSDRPMEVHAVRDSSLPGPAGPLRIRIYRPSDQTNMPGVVFFHGGGWVMGNLDTHDVYCRALTNASQMTVISVDYRLAPEQKFPAAVEDAWAATTWIIENAAEMGLDPTRLAVAGDSAGGNLAAATTLMARDRGTPMPAFQVLIYPATDFRFDTDSYRENAEGYHLTLNDMIWAWRHYLEQEQDGQSPYASPLRAEDLSRLPPALVITAQYDPLRDEGEAYAQRLQAAGVPVQLTRYDGMIHGFARRLGTLARADESLREIVAALRAAFRS
jgi:acetyl esterase